MQNFQERKYFFRIEASLKKNLQIKSERDP